MRMRRQFFALSLVALLPLPAAAHHPMGGAMPETLWQGFASGIGHPVIGLDHLAFLVAAGVLAAALPRSSALRVLASFLIASMGALLAGFALAGLFHGHAFAEAVIGAEATPIIAYLAGLAVIQVALMLGAMALAQQAIRARWLRPAMGAAASFAGLGFLAVALVA